MFVSWLSSQIFKVVCITNKTVSIPSSYCSYFFSGAFFCSQFNSPSPRSYSRFKEFSLRWYVPLLFEKKGKLAEMTTRYLSNSSPWLWERGWLSLVFTCCTTRFHLLYHSLSFVVTRCITRLSFYKRSNKKIGVNLK